MATLSRKPTSPRPFQSEDIAAADTGLLRELIAPEEVEAVSIRVYDSGGNAIPFRVQGHGEDGGAHGGGGWRNSAGEPFPYSRDIGQQRRKPPALGPWSLFVVCEEDGATINVGISYHRNS